MLYILILLLTFQSVLSSYTSCVQSIFDYEDAYYKMKLNLMDHNFDETVDDLTDLTERISTLLDNCNQKSIASLIDGIFPFQCLQSLGQSTKFIHTINKKNLIRNLPTLANTLAKTDIRCPGIDDLMAQLAHRKDPDLNVSSCLAQSQWLVVSFSHIRTDLQIKQHLSILTDDLFDVLNKIQNYLYACDWQKAQIQYESLLPAKCRDEMQEILASGHRLIKQHELKQITLLVKRLGQVMNDCPFLNE